ncbi:MAG: helix-hairpin-helix domain-containing protein [Acidobacteria bacterium]|nr:helix-hairpin-helix domain-containing protein [Acidobacteriota bacterium]
MRIANSYKVFAVVAIAVQMFFISSCSAEVTTTPQEHHVIPDAVNINTATVAELTRIPYIGERTAERIVAFRSEHGPFRRPEDLLLVQGISDQRFRQIRHLVRTE